MKTGLLFIIVFFLSSGPGKVLGQQDFHYIDQQVKNLDAPNPDSLARLLTKDFTSELEKVRAIYSWIAQNISYNTGIFSFARSKRTPPVLLDTEDTMVNWASANEMTAIRVMKKRVAICDGYAKLFHTLCEYAGLRSEIILGYARSGYERETRFRTNHSWNAIMIDGKWQLVDVTWGSGYLNFGNQFVAQMDERYFLPDPEQFFMDHYPEDLKWSLVSDPGLPAEYRRSPYRFKSFIKYNISAHLPGKGIIEALPGDTITLEIELNDLKKARAVSPDPFFDSTVLAVTGMSVFLQPQQEVGNKLVYQVISPGEELKWIHLMFNDDIILRFRVQTRKDVVNSNPVTGKQ